MWGPVGNGDVFCLDVARVEKGTGVPTVIDLVVQVRQQATTSSPSPTVEHVRFFTCLSSGCGWTEDMKDIYFTRICGMNRAAQGSSTVMLILQRKK